MCCFILYKIHYTHKRCSQFTSSVNIILPSSGAKEITASHRGTCKIFTENTRTTEGQEVHVLDKQFTWQRITGIKAEGERRDQNRHLFSSSTEA